MLFPLLKTARFLYGLLILAPGFRGSTDRGLTMNIKKVSPNTLIEKLAGELKKNESIKPPEWVGFVRTGVAKERPPFNKDWWYVRAASVLRRVKLLGPIGVSKLRTKYGSKKNRGARPEKFFRGSGSIARKILQQLEKAELVAQAEKSGHKGRVVSPKGQSLIDRATIQIMKDSGAEFPKKEKAPASKPVKAKPKVPKKTEQAKTEQAKNKKSKEAN